MVTETKEQHTVPPGGLHGERSEGQHEIEGLVWQVVLYVKEFEGEKRLSHAGRPFLRFLKKGSEPIQPQKPRCSLNVFTRCSLGEDLAPKGGGGGR